MSYLIVYASQTNLYYFKTDEEQFFVDIAPEARVAAILLYTVTSMKIFFQYVCH